MVYMGQTDRYMGEVCWTWGGSDSCIVIIPTYSLDISRTNIVTKETRYSVILQEWRVVMVDKENRMVIVRELNNE